MKYLVENDLFGIAERIKSIDDSYYVVFNNRLKRYEVHSNDQRGDSLAVVLPFPQLDHRAIWHVYNTRIERAREMLEKIEQENLRLEQEAFRKKLDKAANEVFG